MFNFFKKKDTIENLIKKNFSDEICKCCGANAAFLDVCDFNKNCEEYRGIYLDKSNIDINYHQCSKCGFLFTNAFESFNSTHYAKYIYNDEYIKVDPDYNGKRPLHFSKIIKQMFPNEKVEMLDFGGGQGILSRELNKTGFKMDTYDPFSVDYKDKPNKKYKMIFSFEVVEHSPDPISTFKELFDLLDEGGIIVFSTLLLPQDIKGLDWWYISPRNGHISIHTPQSLAHSINRSDYVVAPFGKGLHIIFNPDNRPDFSNNWFNSKP